MERPRRRFIPRIDGLEVRELMTGGAARPAVVAAQANALAASAKTPGWLQRIEHLPRFLYTVNRYRYVPPELITTLQADLLALAMRLKAPPSWALSQFNRQVRATIPHPSAPQDAIFGLSNKFGLVLLKAHAPVDLINKFQKDMLSLAAVDSAQSNPAQTIAGDYSTMLQLSLGVGLTRPPKTKPHSKPRTR